jgi:hypothetical protein
VTVAIKNLGKPFGRLVKWKPLPNGAYRVALGRKRVQLTCGKRQGWEKAHCQRDAFDTLENVRAKERKRGRKILRKEGVQLEHEARACYFELLPRSGGTGRRAGLKIQWYLVPCGFDPLLRDQSHRLEISF